MYPEKNALGLVNELLNDDFDCFSHPVSPDLVHLSILFQLADDVRPDFEAIELV